MSLDYRTLANLRDLLARLYYRDRDIERIVDSLPLAALPASVPKKGDRDWRQRE